MKHDYHNIISATAASSDQLSSASPSDNIVWLEHLIHIDLSVRQSVWQTQSSAECRLHVHCAVWSVALCQ